MTADEALSKRTSTDIEQKAQSWANNILFLIEHLHKLKIMHGDMHLGNIGVTASHRLTLIDFDQSSTKVFVPGFDLVTVIDALQPYRFMLDGKCVNTKLLHLISMRLLPKIPANWLMFKSKKMYPDLQKLAHCSAVSDNP